MQIPLLLNIEVLNMLIRCILISVNRRCQIVALRSASFWYRGGLAGSFLLGGVRSRSRDRGQWEAGSLLGGLPERSPNGSTSRETTSCHPSLHQAGANQTERQVNF